MGDKGLGHLSDVGTQVTQPSQIQPWSTYAHSMRNSGLLQDIGNSWRSANAVTPLQRPAGPVLFSGATPAAGVIAGLQRGKRSVCIQAVGDSTTVGVNAWFAGLGRRIGARFPKYAVVHRSFSEANDDWNAPAGLDTNHTERGVVLNGGVFVYRPTVIITDDLDIRVKAAAVDWSNGATQVLAAKWNTGNASRSFSFGLNSTGNLTFASSADGTTSLTTVTSSAVVPFTDGQAGWCRVTLDADNGAAGRTVTFSTSTDGNTWTQLGSATTTAGTTTIFQSAEPLALGSRYLVSIYTDKFVGTIYWVEVRKGLKGEVVAPVLADWWDYISVDEQAYSWVGDPVLLMVNGGIGGQKISYFSDVARVNQLHMNHGADLFMLNDSHNEASLTNQDWLATLKTYITMVKTHLVDVPIVLVGQNPVNQDIYSANAVSKRFARIQRLATWALSQPGIYFADSVTAFNNIPLQISADGLHPTTSVAVPSGKAGYEVWADELYQQLFDLWV